MEDLVSIYEIAGIAGVTSPAVANWRKRYPDFPKPIAELKSGPIFRTGQIKSWLRKRRVNMSKIISVINLKGGVGKTTTTVAVAEILSGYFNKKVLVIDLDPQTNATTMLIGEEKWRKLNEQGYTLAQLFKDALDPDNRKFDLEKTLQKRVSNVQEVRTLDLLPSSLDLIEVQDRLATMPTGQFYAENPTDILRESNQTDNRQLRLCSSGLPAKSWNYYVERSKNFDGIYHSYDTGRTFNLRNPANC